MEVGRFDLCLERKVDFGVFEVGGRGVLGCRNSNSESCDYLCTNLRWPASTLPSAMIGSSLSPPQKQTPPFFLYSLQNREPVKTLFFTNYSVSGISL